MHKPTGTISLQFSVSSRLSFIMRMKCCVPGNSFSKPVYVFIIICRLLIYEHIVLPVSV